MLTEIRIRGLGVIDDAELELGPGLTVITGETGAGKTMVLTGLDLLMGGRADAGTVRAGCTRAVVEGRVVVPVDGAVATRAVEAGAELEQISDAPRGPNGGRPKGGGPNDAGAGTAELVLARTVQSEGRSRAYVGGRAAPVTLLNELAEGLVTVHGQGDQQRLLRRSRQLEALDRYAEDTIGPALAAYTRLYERLRAVDAELSDLVSLARERARDAELLRLGLAEVEAVDPRPDEDVALRAEEDRLANAGALRDAAELARAALSGDETAPDQTDVLGLLGRARQEMDGQRDHDPHLAALADRLGEVAYLASDLAADLASYAASIDTDPARLASVQERRAALATLVRKYGDPETDTAGSGLAAVLQWAQDGARRLLELDGDDDRIASLTAEKATLTGELAGIAAELTDARSAAAERFGTQVTAELAALAMPHARVQVEVRPRDTGRSTLELPDGRVVGPSGADEVEILFSAHHGAQFRPLDKGASGGELSRLMLAIEVVFAGADPVPTFVFDEVDAGVGGKAAVEVGRRLAMLARHAQVVVVTHLPQVAAFADHHLKVVKADDGRVTTSGIVTLDDSARVVELSRMLAGLEGSASAQAHAEELLALAATTRDEARARGSKARSSG